MKRTPRSAAPPPEGEPTPARSPDRASTVPNRSDLAVLRDELRRVQTGGGGGAGAPTRAEAVTLAATAMRLVEAQLGHGAGARLEETDLTMAREVLRSASAVLRAALIGIEDQANSREPAGRLRRRRGARKMPQGQS